ncbi:PREDICTED: vegetative incompatibility protein HET-E-1 [Nelumbo nucifera]|uniref:Vegetative incompatibility protein HET-E-1 n=1 Tax=Nelumbo nucifera TaxID=4432 RepID=A0A1U8Q0K9_NELNU|nr:PREDICTED: vegetative incompatibility protein HET-E-1 [Nelumbo nucifera]
MKVISWIGTISALPRSSTATEATIPLSNEHIQSSSPKLLLSDPCCSLSEIPSSSTASQSQDTSCSTLQSNLSLLTLPSVPSLQKISPESLQVSVSHLCVSSLKPNTCIGCLAVSGDLLYVASGSEINVYSLTNYAHIDAFNGNSSSGSVKSLAFSEGKAFTAHQDSKIRVWQLTPTKRHQHVATLPTVKDRVRRFVLPKNYVRVRRHKKRLWIEHADAVSGLAVRNGLIYSVSWDKCLKVWRASDLRCLESVKAHEDAINAVAVSVDGTVYTAGADRRIRVWGRTSGERRHTLIATLEKHKSAVNALALTSDASVLFSGACDRSILVWEREDSAHHMAVTGALRGHTGAILCLVNISDFLVSGSSDRTVRIWRRGRDSRFCCLTVLEGHERPVKSLVALSDSVSSGSISVCSGSLDGETKVWQVLISNLRSSLSSSDTEFVD